jgi:ring-1,2-phenylacetyl-CoA epoxidase subunit PaaE
MSSSPSQEGFAAFTVKRIEGGRISNWLCDAVKEGTVLRARGPIGKFVFDSAKDRGHLVMVAGGSGVTPFVSILREYQARLGQAGAPARMTLLVSYRTRADLICWRELTEAAGHSGVKVITTLTREDQTAPGVWHGRIGETMLERGLAGTYETATFMTCGPQAIMDETVAHLKRRSVGDEHIKTESFES